MKTNIEKRIRKGIIKRLFLVQQQRKQDLFIEWTLKAEYFLLISTTIT